MPRIPESEIERVKRSTDLLALVRGHGIELKKHGSKDWVGLCPFHDDRKKPNLVISPAKGLFHCMVCGAAGSVIDWVMRLDKLTFPKAVAKLRGQAPAQGRRTEPGFDGVAPAALAPERAQVLLERVVAVYEKTFGESPEGRAYLEQRGITDANLWTQHRIGYCNGRLPELLPSQGAIHDELKTLGVLLANGRERFTGCVVFPILDTEGRFVTLYGRQAEPGPNAADAARQRRHFFLPGRPTGLWNTAALKTYASVILVESVLDGLSVRMAGHANVVAIQGTNGFDSSDASLLAGHGVQQVTLLLDGDAAGKTAAGRLQTLLSSFSCRSLELPESHDPNSYLLAHGAKGLAGFITNSAEHGEASKPSTLNPQLSTVPGGFAVQFGGPDGAQRRYEIRGLEKGPRKLKATVRVEHGGRLHVDTLDFYAARWRRQLAQDLARIFEEPADVIEADITRLMSVCEQAEAGAACAQAAGATAVEAMTPEARAQAGAFGKDPGLIENILADFERCGLVGEKANKLLCYLAGVSRKMEKPLSLLILSSSGAGKTTLQDIALAFCPPEDLVKLTSLSGKALFYKETASLKHKVLALEEGDGVAEAMYALRNLISAGQLVTEATIKDPATGRMTTMENRVEGPTAVFLTTTNPEIDAETKSRFFVTSVDESKEQTQAVLICQRRRQTLSGLADRLALEPILEKHRNFQRLLKPLAVVNPYADQLRYGDDRLQSRRDQPKYLSLIHAVALLRQMQKPLKTWTAGGQSRAYLEVDREDIRLANELAHAILGHSLDELSRPAHNLLLQLVELRLAAKKKNTAQVQPAFTRREIREFTGWSNARVHRYLQELIELEYVLAEHGRNGVLHHYRLAYDSQGQDGQKFVLGLKPVEELREP